MASERNQAIRCRPVRVDEHDRAPRSKVIERKAKEQGRLSRTRRPGSEQVTRPQIDREHHNRTRRGLTDGRGRGTLRGKHFWKRALHSNTLADRGQRTAKRNRPPDWAFRQRQKIAKS